MAQRTLWGAIDRDRRRWIRASALVVLLLVLLVGAVWVVVTSHSVRAWELVIRVVAPLAAILMFPIFRAARELRTKEAIGAVPVATGMAPETKGALYDVTLAAGLPKAPKLLMYLSDAPNAFATRVGGGLSISVSSAFSELPRAEQRAGIAMLVGRSRVDTTSFAAEHQVSESFREDPVPPDRDPILFAAWIDAAVAGDREGLKILGEPVPMIELLERLSIVSTVVPEFAYAGGHDAVFGFLAWPYLDSAKVMAEELGEYAGAMPRAAAAAVAAVIAEEQILYGSAGFAGAAESSISGAEAIRTLRLREVAGAEGAVAGSTTAAARERARREAPEPDPAPPAAAPPAPPAAAAATGRLAVALVAAAAPRPDAQARAAHIAVRCSACGAGNAPGNRTCIACGRRMPEAG
jgi:hypothetical protein